MAGPKEDVDVDDERGCNGLSVSVEETEADNGEWVVSLGCEAILSSLARPSASLSSSASVEIGSSTKRAKSLYRLRLRPNV